MNDVIQIMVHTTAAITITYATNTTPRLARIAVKAHTRFEVANGILFQTAHAQKKRRKATEEKGDECGPILVLKSKDNHHH
jgi:hypothetical protein